MQTLRRGSTGPLIAAWQQFLRGQDLFLNEVSDHFDEATEEASKAFQRAHGLVADGIVGNQTFGQAMLLGFELVKSPETDKSSPNWPPVPPGLVPASLPLRQQLFGVFSYEPAPTLNNPEGIRIGGSWVNENITSVKVPQLIGVTGAPSSGVVPFHKKAAPQLVAMFAAWEAAGLLPLVRTFAGTWAPRFIRGSRTSLSNHAWATAIDLNAPWNGFQQRPALVGQMGSVRELVPIAVEHGFYWGGWFSGRPDGMHFEVCRLL